MPSGGRHTWARPSEGSSLTASGPRRSSPRIRSLLKKAPAREDRLDINEAVSDIISLTWGEMRKHGATLKTELAEGLPSVERRTDE